jgi:hypothetical protein
MFVCLSRSLAMMWLNRTPEWFEAEPNPQNCSVRFLDGLDDRGYIFDGFSQKHHHQVANDANEEDVVDDEEDVVAYTQRTMTSLSSGVERQESDLMKRLEELQEEMDQIRASLISFR